MASRGFMQAFSVKTDLRRFYRKQETSPKSWKDFFQLFPHLWMVGFFGELGYEQINLLVNYLC